MNLNRTNERRYQDTEPHYIDYCVLCSATDSSKVAAVFARIRLYIFCDAVLRPAGSCSAPCRVSRVCVALLRSEWDLVKYHP